MNHDTFVMLYEFVQVIWKRLKRKGRLSPSHLPTPDGRYEARGSVREESMTGASTLEQTPKQKSIHRTMILGSILTAETPNQCPKPCFKQKSVWYLKNVK